ncbi:MAG: beta-propeller repeat-containing protein [Bacteroidetes bacterium]|nr:beta-propeller repeat-containing protein [Bacteroidota bacterium]
MRHLRILSGILILILIVAFTTQADNKYIGVKKCMACHKVEKLGGLAYTVWEKSAHAKAYQTLLGDEAKKIAKEKGLKTAPNESPECLKCHVTGGGAAKNIDAGFKKEEGVTCEACHNAASGYLTIHSKKTEADKAKAKAAGLVKLEKNEKSCTTCHNSESPSFKGFKFEEMWAKIEHKRPAKK